MVTTTIALSLLASQGPGLGSMMLSKRGDVEMVYVPAGKFIMGSTNGLDEMPVRQVFLSAYWIGRNDVTVGQFAAFCQATGYRYRWNQQPASYWREDHPMVNVTWNEARLFCKWAGGDLPTEAQWEKAARGTDGRNFPWGNDWDPSRGWFDTNEKVSNGMYMAINTVPVGTYPSGKSPYGCLDMAGQITNWCLDYYADKYNPDETNNPTGPNHGQLRVFRGGSWFNVPNYYRCAFRNFGAQSDPKVFYVGFRMAYRKSHLEALNDKKLQSIVSKALHGPGVPQPSSVTLIPPVK